MPKIYQLLALFFLLAAAPARAQLPATAAGASVPALTRQDTARAVHELFKSRRGGGFSWLAFGGAGTAASIIPAQQTTSAGVWTPGVVIGSTLALLGTKKLLQFGWGREHRVLQDLAATGHLPADVKRRLRGDFAPLHGTASQPDPFLALAAPRPTPAPAGATPTPAVTTPAPATAPAPAVTTPPTLAPSAVQLLADARTDTLDAVTGLFMARRSAGTWPLVILLPVARIMAGATATTPASSPYAPQQAAPSDGAVAAGLGLMGAGLVFMLVHNAPYSQAHLAALQTSYKAGQPLPATIRQKLRPQHLTAGRRYRERLERRAARQRH
ncbi:hypothetical protein [Hymenobacter sp. UYCo722]|uniref:hypothetical protein n=1 Tax=Hymenobacter sp. UYCo722 TaxID=3156335 RepID=UPI003393715B